MKVVIFSSPSREDMLENLLQELHGKGVLDITVIDDPNTYGKRNFWKRWEQARQICVDSVHDNYMIIPDDISQIDISTVKDLHTRFKGSRFVASIISDGRLHCWGSTPRPDRYFDMNGYQFKDYQFFDCGGVTNRETLHSIVVDPIPEHWFNEPGKSSGVGHQLTKKLRDLRVPMYQVQPSLSYHGLHESMMHPSTRKSTPLVSIPKRPKVIVGMATFGDRDEARKLALHSLIGQADRIILYNNDDNPDLTDNAKFYGLTFYPEEPVYYFSCDDDLIYPPTYVEDMITAIERYKCIVTHHGRILRGLDFSYYRGHKSFRCLGAVGEDQVIDVAGTGVTAFRTDYFNPVGIHKAEDKKMMDIVFSLEAKKQDKKIMLLKHPQGYIKQIPVPEGSEIYTTENKSEERQIQLANEIFKLK